MFVLVALIVVGSGRVLHGAEHSLMYIYTALSKPVGLPGIHDFTAMGLVDNRQIDYFDSTSQTKVPRQPWMAERLPEDYWEKGTQSRRSKQQWFKVNIDILMKRMRQNDSDTHVLQWIHGCKGHTQENGQLKFTQGIDKYSYDGEDFLSFDDANQVWVAPTAQAQPTKRKWDGVTVLKDYTKGYLENECMDWLDKFMRYGQKQLQHTSPPEVFLFVRPARDDANVVLHCFATGFYPKDIIVEIKRDDRVLTWEDGVKTTGVRPNEDDTFQRRDYVEIPKWDRSNYTCTVNHSASLLIVEKAWDHHLPETDWNPLSIGLSLGFLLGAAVVFLLVKRKEIVSKCRGKKESTYTKAAVPFISVTPPGGTDKLSSDGRPSVEGMVEPLMTGSKDSLEGDKRSDSGLSSNGSSIRMEEESEVTGRV